MTLRMRGALMVAMLFLVATAGGAQSVSSSARLASRAELESVLREHESSAISTAYSARLRSRAREEASAVRLRLARGDFSVGDRIQLRVVGPTQLFNDTVTVGDSLIVAVPGIRQVRLYGVLRSELQSVLARDLGEVVKQVEVDAHPLLRIAVLGSVTTPGFRAVPSETLLDQLITRSGGPTSTAGMDRMQLVRGDTVLMEGAAVMAAIARGSTLDALDLRDGDVLVVPVQGAPWDRAAVLQIAFFFATPLLTLFLVR